MSSILRPAIAFSVANYPVVFFCLGLTAAERDELARLRRENKQLRLERDILSRASIAYGP